MKIGRRNTIGFRLGEVNTNIGKIASLEQELTEVTAELALYEGIVAVPMSFTPEELESIADVRFQLSLRKKVLKRQIHDLTKQ